ncbi:DNA-binding protein [Marmoricola endophyticus]|uniref:DNA-binding protein n=1 Tax=Marmoricola endophyticus TaxID=2040280 RepID=A0A917BP01_9ACTN|nr:helix-turn-helix transcriptional regulator [Marmoricola endophyticus]GGF51271.1 DNA-binding protein [Marmoricola endophyticus]
MDRERLADFLRRRREALQPEDVGLVAAARRRTPGLRREEVALLASMSSDYYTRLEQARGPQPSPQMLGAITRALHLSLTERDHLYRLGGQTPPASDVRSDHVSPGVRRVLDRIDTPAMVLNDLGEVLAQNAQAVALLGDETRFADGDLARSRVYRWFTDATARRIHPPEEHEEYSRSYTAMLHLAAGRHPDDPRTRAMVDGLRAASPEFAALWAGHDVTWRPGPERKTFLHPEVGAMQLDCEQLTAPRDGQLLLVYTATPGTDSAERLRLLEVVGHQRFADPVQAD